MSYGSSGRGRTPSSSAKVSCAPRMSRPRCGSSRSSTRRRSECRVDQGQDLRHHQREGRPAGGGGGRRRAGLHLRRGNAALHRARSCGGDHRPASAIRDDGRNLRGSRPGQWQGGGRGGGTGSAAVPWRGEARGPRRLRPAGDQDHQAAAGVDDRGPAGVPGHGGVPGAVLQQSRRRGASRHRGPVERGRGPRASGVAPRRAHRCDLPRPAEAESHSLRWADPRERGPGHRHREAGRRRREPGGGGAARHQGPGQGAALRGRGSVGMKSRLPDPGWLPDAAGHFGRFGGRYVPETLMAPLVELEKAYRAAMRGKRFTGRLRGLLTSYAGRPTPLYFAERLTKHCGGARIFLKREDLCHTGAHKINNVLGQALLAERMGKRRIIAETGAGQHGVASATAAALLGLECQVYMGSVDIARQALNVFRMKLLGAAVIPVESGSKTLKDAVNEALWDWVTNVRSTYYLLGSALGPHPYPMMVRDFHRFIGEEARAQARKITGKLPDLLVACVGGGSNAIGLFWPFIKDTRVRIVGVEPGGHGLSTGKHGASLGAGAVGVLHGSMSYVLQNDDGQIAEAHSISAGLDYPGSGPEHAYYKETGRFQYESATDAEALEAFGLLTRLEGIMPALESAHAVAWAMKAAGAMKKTQSIVIGLSGRGDKDVHTVEAALAEVHGRGAASTVWTS